jgi:thymidylate synthase (FAD)
MTSQADIANDPNYIPVLDHGFVGLVGHLGDDRAIVDAARCSYGPGTKQVSDDRGLIRYLMRHAHHSPYEMCQFQFNIKMPIFVARQLLRHRTASVNELSARYSVMADEFYMPDEDRIQPQSRHNRQGRQGDVDPVSRTGVRWLMDAAYAHAYDGYRALLGDRDVDDHYDPYHGVTPLLTDEFPGLARELARNVLPLATYTQCYFSIDLRNLFGLLKQRLDQQAQYEIRVYAQAMFDLIKPIVPLAVESFVDYQLEAVSFSRMELAYLRDRLNGTLDPTPEDAALIEQYGLSARELRELRSRLSDATAP